MLDFVVRFRLAHILRKECDHHGESPLLQACLDDLSHALRLTGPDNAGAITCFIYVILCALEIATSFNSVSTLSWLFDQLALICTQHCPLIANVAIQISRYDSNESLLDLLKKARHVIPTGPGSNVAASIALQVYLEIVDVAANTGSPTEVYSTLQKSTNKLFAGTSPSASETLTVWIEVRCALAVYEAKTSSGQQVSSPQSHGDPVELRTNAISCILDYLQAQRDVYEKIEGWAIAGRLDREVREIPRLLDGGSSEATGNVASSEVAKECLGGTTEGPRRACRGCGDIGHNIQTCKSINRAAYPTRIPSAPAD